MMGAPLPSSRSRSHGPIVAAAEGPARRGGLRAGDRLVRAGDGEVVDVLDLDWAAADGAFDLEVERDGRTFALRVAPARGESHDIELEGGLGDDVRGCVNECSFCFVEQMPLGLRPSLYVKDDDYRLSFLQGNFITLSNLDERDLRRIERLRLSPLYVSLHAWDDAVREKLMGRATRRSRTRLVRLAAAGIAIHVQVVLCPDHNDGDVLRETVLRLSEVAGVEDVGVVPVSLTDERRLRRVAIGDAVAAVGLLESLQEDLRRRLGRRFAHAADELYLLAGRMPPAADAPRQYENGIGVAAAFLEEARALADERRERGVRPPLALLTGTLAEPVVAEACEALGSARAFTVENGLFGSHVTVTGLLGGNEVLDALTERPLREGEWLLAPRAFLPLDLGRTLDDVEEADLRTACAGRLAIGDDLADAFATLPGP
jgi:putative radical SAM enzyme (TIGR03279 family)